VPERLHLESGHAGVVHGTDRKPEKNAAERAFARTGAAGGDEGKGGADDRDHDRKDGPAGLEGDRKAGAPWEHGGEVRRPDARAGDEARHAGPGPPGRPGCKAATLGEAEGDRRGAQADQARDGDTAERVLLDKTAEDLRHREPGLVARSSRHREDRATA
jgi:hypothetical protein